MKKSYFNLGRCLTDIEFEQLKNWKKKYPNLAWSRGDIKDNLVFYNYSKGAKNGEYWITQKQYMEFKEKLRNWETEKRRKNGSKPIVINLNLPLRDKPLDDSRRSYFNVNRRLTEQEWNELCSWRKENLEKKWRFGDRHPLIDNLFFNYYCKQKPNGECWIPRNEEGFKQWQEEKGKSRRLRINKKMKEDSVFKMNMKVRNIINKSLRKFNSENIKSSEILGISTFQFKTWLEKNFENWMNWENYGQINNQHPNEANQRWNIDHIIPIAYAKTVEDVILLNHHLNLRPICGYYNCFIKKERMPPQHEIDELLAKIRAAKEKYSQEQQNLVN